jgi:hypothetical protein
MRTRLKLYSYLHQSNFPNHACTWVTAVHTRYVFHWPNAFYNSVGYVWKFNIIWVELRAWDLKTWLNGTTGFSCRDFLLQNWSAESQDFFKSLKTVIIFSKYFLAGMYNLPQVNAENVYEFSRIMTLWQDHRSQRFWAVHHLKHTLKTQLYTVEPWIASIIRSRNVLVIQNTRISKLSVAVRAVPLRGRREGKTGSIVNTWHSAGKPVLLVLQGIARLSS